MQVPSRPALLYDLESPFTLVASPQAELDAMAARMKAAARAAEADRETLSAELAALRGELAAEQEAARTQTKASRAAAAAHADEIMHCNAQAAELSTQVSRREPSRALVPPSLHASVYPSLRSCNGPTRRSLRGKLSSPHRRRRR